MALETRPPTPTGEASSPVPPLSHPPSFELRPPVRHRGHWLSGAAGNPSAVAVVVWLLALPAAVIIPRHYDLDPFSQRAWSLSLGAGFAMVAGVLAIGLGWARRTGRAQLPVLAGASAGLLAGWVALTLRVALTATPYGYGGLIGDAGRQVALATRFSVTATSADAWIPGLPSEYPPLYFWLTGRAAAVLGTPAWKLIGDAQVLTMSAVVIAGFVLWRRLVPPWAALAIVGLVLASFGDPRKPFEVITVVVFVPWLLATFGEFTSRTDQLSLEPARLEPAREEGELGPPRRGRLHWLPAGLIGGLIVLTYQAWLVFGALGMLALIVRTWRVSQDRRRYLYHLAGVAAVAVVVSSWYVVPLLYASLTRDTKSVSDLFAPGSMQSDVMPWLAATPLGVLQLVGLAGLVWLRRTTWWAAPLLLLTAGVFVFRILATLRFAITGHTLFLHYTSHLYSTVLIAAGVLVLAHAAPILARRLAAPAAASTVPAAPSGISSWSGAAALPVAVASTLAVTLAFVCYSYSGDWLPGAGAPTAHYAAEAHLEPLPGGGYSRYAPASPRTAPFPTYAVRDAVTRVLGPDPRRVTLSIDERLFAYLPWPGYTTTSRGASGSLVLWDQRAAEIQRLTTITDPAQFAQDSAHTRFGPIDVFVLQRDGTAWTWRDQRFSPSQFDSRNWVVDTGLPDNVVVAIRR